MQSDCLEVVVAAKNDNNPATGLGILLNDIHVICQNFSSIYFAFLSRSCNVVSHNLARYAISISADAPWMGVVLSCAMHEVVYEQKALL